MMGSRKDYERPPVANMPMGQMVVIAFVATVTIAIVLTVAGVEETSFNFCPNACDDCVDKVTMIPQNNISACAPVWNQMSSGVAPEFTGLLEQNIFKYHCKWDGLYGGTHIYDLTGSSEEMFGNCRQGIEKEISWEYLYTYQIQNAVQFDFCVQEYYKQHFGGDA